MKISEPEISKRSLILVDKMCCIHLDNGSVFSVSIKRHERRTRWGVRGQKLPIPTKKNPVSTTERHVLTLQKNVSFHFRNIYFHS